jgi:pimeloyl-ACP methyl ester carboxylesterase
MDTIRVQDLTVACALPARPAHPPVLFIHGYFADARVWADWLPFFAARGFPAYAVNLRGRAGSKPGVNLGRVSLDDFADDAALVARHVGAEVIVGHSMGGLVAQQLASRGIGRAAVLVTPAPPRGIVLWNPRLMRKQLKHLPSVMMSRVVPPDLGVLRELALNRVPPDMQATSLAMLVPDSGAAGREMSITGVSVDRAAVTATLLVIAAEDDRFIPLPVVRRIATRYGAELRVVPKHGHMIVIEPGWQALADEIIAWIQEQGPGS